MRKVFLLVFLLVVSLFADDLFVETLDEQSSSANLEVFRFRITNGGNPIKNVVLKYSLKKAPGKNISVENYYLESASANLHEIDSENAYIEIALGDVSNGVFPNQSGFSIGIHYSDWSPRDKSLDFSNPQSSIYSRAENVGLYVDGKLVYGNVVENELPANINAKFTAFRPGYDNGSPFVDIKNTGTQSILPELLYVRNSENQKQLVLNEILDAGEKVRIYLGALPGDFRIGREGELFLEYGSTPVDYIVWGAPGENISGALEYDLWDYADDFIKKFGEDAFGFVPLGDSLFYGRLDMERNNSHAWQVYSEYESDSYEEYLPDAPPYALPDGIGIVLEKGQPMRFVWNRVPLAEQYRLVVLSAKDSSLVYENTFASNAADVSLPEGEYLWGVQASNSQRQFKPMSRPAIGAQNNLVVVEPVMGAFTPRQRILIQYAKDLMNYNEFVRIGAPFDTIASSNGRKDTKLLNVSWGEFADVRGWDTEHTQPDPMTRPLDEDEGYRCWAIAIQELNHYYTTKNGVHGNLTLDEIIANVKIHFDTTDDVTFQRKEPSYGAALAPFRLLGNAGGSRAEESFGLSYALNINTLVLVDDGVLNKQSIYFDVNANQWITSTLVPKWENMLKQNKPIYMVQQNKGSPSSHAMIVDGYRIDENENIEFHFINTDNYGTNQWRIYQEDDLGKHLLWFFEIDVPTDVALTDPDVHNDDDNDGVMNFDEKHRFDSDYQKKDTDGDKIDDKTEIHSYTIRECGEFTKPSAIRPQMTFAGISKETLADVDGDGFRAENDVDSDGDGLEDGMEDVNHNGYIDAGETDPYTVDYFQQMEEKIDIPEDIAFYALDFLRLNDGVMCRHFNGKKLCNIASENEGDAAVILGVNVPVVDVYTKGKVWLRDSASAEIIRYYGLPSFSFSTDMQQGASVVMEANLNASQWPYMVPKILPKSNSSQIDKIVKHGEQFTLTDGSAFRSLKVEAGGTLYISTGEMVVENLQLDADANIYFLNPGYETIVHVNKTIKWNADIINTSPVAYAQGFKLYYYGTEAFDVAGRWGGSLIAPNAKVILGQNWNKEIYGQFLAKQIVVHQYAKVWKVAFNPITLDVALKER